MRRGDRRLCRRGHDDEGGRHRQGKTNCRAHCETPWLPMEPIVVRCPGAAKSELGHSVCSMVSPDSPTQLCSHYSIQCMECARDLLVPIQACRVASDHRRDKKWPGCAPILDNTRILVISYLYEDSRGHRGTQRPCARTPTGDLSVARPTRSRGTAGGRHRATRWTFTVIADVPPAESSARWTDCAAPRKSPAHLLGRLHRDERPSRLLDRELLR